MTPLRSIYTIIFIGIALFAETTHAQTFWFGVKGGAGMNLQSWGNGTSASTNRDPLFSLNTDLFLETYDPDKKGALYGSLGFHTRGSSLRFFSLNNVFQGRQSFKFHNIVLDLGAKKTLNIGGEFNPYFTLGVRFEYTV